MADSGANVIVGVRENGSSWNLVKEDGMTVKTIEDAAKEADIIHILLPDETQEKVYNEQIAPYVEAGNTISFSHGYNIHFGLINPADADVFCVEIWTSMVFNIPSMISEVA